MKTPEYDGPIAPDPRELLRGAENTRIFQEAAEEVLKDSFKNGVDLDIERQRSDWAFLRNKTPGYEY